MPPVTWLRAFMNRLNPLWKLLLPDFSLRLHTASHATQVIASTLKGAFMRGLKTLLGSTALVVGLAMAPAAQAQIEINVGIQPVCSYGYYDYAPYACAPYGFYGPGYFYNGIFLGMGPWAGWGYGHGWGDHRFTEERGGRYHGGGGAMANRSSFARGGKTDRGQARPAGRSGGGAQMHGNSPASHAGGARPEATRSAPARATAPHAAPRAAATPRPSAPRASAPHSSGGGHASGGGGGGHEGGGEHK